MTQLTLMTAEDDTFVRQFIATGNYAASYKLAFDPYDRLSKSEAWQYAKMKLAQPAIRDAVGDYHRDLRESAKIDLDQVLRRWTDIATADPDELCSLRVGACRYCHGAAHGYQWRETEYAEALDEAERLQRAGAAHVEWPQMRGGFGYDHTAAPAPDCPHCNGEGETRAVFHDTRNLSPQAKLLYGGVKQTRNGIEVIMADRMKALEHVTRMLGGYEADERAKAPTLVQNTQYVQNNFTDAATAARAYEDMVKAGKS